ncbi:sarcolemmal membrane-associated protein [Prorops nasuta]|uniref:sarcolemmal membrane-associated protein n=1 Tax=Prorops nasuta TaxID=863751 RepID=UPI0034CE5C6A
MVVASGGWGRNANFPVGQDETNLEMNTAQETKMTAKGILICRDNSHPFQERTLSLEQPVKIGRSVAKARASPSNAIFDCKVLSRNHALLWYTAGKFYLQDTRSSNGTFINNQRLSPSGLESTPKEVCSGDIVQFGVDVVESTKKVTHGCIVATLKLYLPDGKEAKASLSTSVASTAGNVTMDDLYKLNYLMQEAAKREKSLCGKVGYLRQLVENTKKAANQSWKAMIAEDRLLSWVDTVESQLAVYSTNYTEDKIRNDLAKLLEEKAEYQNTAKEALQKILEEKLEVTQRLVQLETRLSGTEEECQSLHNVSKYTQTELQELANKYTEAQKKLQETTNKLMETEEKLKDTLQTAEQEKNELQLQEISLNKRLFKFVLDSADIQKQITALRNYTQTLQDTISKLVAENILDAKDEENLLETIDAIKNQLNSKLLNNQSLCDEEDNLTEYILPPPSRKTLVNGNADPDNVDIKTESDTNSEMIDDTSSINSDEVSEKSFIENKKEENIVENVKDSCIIQKIEVRFANIENNEEIQNDYLSSESLMEESRIQEVVHDDVKEESSCNESNNKVEEEHLEAEYIKTLKPSSKIDAPQNIYARECILQTFIESLDSLKQDDDLESQELVKKELEDLRSWLVHESDESVVSKLKELYYGAKNEAQRIQEVNEELVILKEKCNVLVEEKTELTKNYTTLKMQCGDLSNASYTIPIHYVAPIAVALLWLLFEKLF